MVFVDGLDPLDLACWRSFEIAPDLGMQGRLVVLDRQQVVGLGLKGRLGDGGVAAHGVNRDQGPSEIQTLHQGRDGGDLVRLLLGCLLSQYQSAGGGEGRDQMQGLVASLAVMAAARGFAIDRHQLELVRPALCDPGRETVHEQRGINPVHHCAQPIGAGNAKVEL